MKVIKFGGTSVGSVESLKKVKGVVEGNRSVPLVVVVSALGGITDFLINTARNAVKGIDSAEAMDYIKRRHYTVVDELVPRNEHEEVKKEVGRLLEELSNIFKGLTLLRDLSDGTLDIVMSYGERLSSFIISHILEGSVLINSMEIIKTRTNWGKHTFDNETSLPLIKEKFSEIKSDGDGLYIMPGFISTDSVTGKITNLGRGGSDYTASIIAASLNADSLEIWTDVDGFMTADPRIIDKAYVIEHLSFSEAMELCNFGAKVLYPPTIYPVCIANIPIYIKNTFNPEAPGTLITASGHAKTDEGDKPIKGISSINDTSLISISGLGMVGIVGINARIFVALAKNGISVFMVSQASSENNTSLAVRDSDATKALEVLTKEFSSELASGSISEIKVRDGLSTVAVVGSGMKNMPGVAGKLFNTLGRNGINTISCAQGANETNISFVIETRDLRKSLNVIHDSFFLSPVQMLNLFIVGVGNVGKSLIKQIKLQKDKLRRDKALQVNIVGIANSRKALFDRNGINLENYEELLATTGKDTGDTDIANEIIGMNIYNPVFIDCTSSERVASLYKSLLLHNVNIVAANKLAASGNLKEFKELKEIARQRNVKFLYETNVGAGLPILSTIGNLINSGDHILSIEAVVSGTLNYILNSVDEDFTLSEAIMGAISNGYSEPDPRTDLSGVDVMRKLLILARESGYDLESDSVKASGFIPKEYLEKTKDEFLATVSDLNGEFEAMRKSTERKGERLRFVARFDSNSASLGLESVDASHPFYELGDSTNVVSITTDRYKDFPIVIKGYGAGAEVTAAGVFADIISIANVR